MMIIKTRFKSTGLSDPIPGPILFCGTNFALFDPLQLAKTEGETIKKTGGVATKPAWERG